MKKTSSILAISSALAGSAFAIDSSFHVGYSSDYVWRGVNQASGTNEGLYEFGLDFTGECNCGATWNAGIWQADFAGGGEELDTYASIAKEYGAVELSLGIIRYDFGNGSGADTTELVLGAGTEVAGLSVGAALYYDIEAADGLSWFEISAGKSFDVGSGATLDLSVNYGSSLESGGSYTTLGVTAAVSKELGENLSGALYLAGEQTESNAGDGDDLWGGISLSYGF